MVFAVARGVSLATGGFVERNRDTTTLYDTLFASADEAD